MGLMDGFENDLKSALRNSVGDGILYNQDGFFKIDDSLSSVFKDENLTYSGYVKTEGFLIYKNISKGVVIHGINPEDHGFVTGLEFPVLENEIVIGKELAELGDVKVGDDIVITFAQSKRSGKSLPKLHRFQVKAIVAHGVYNKDLRFTYINLSELQDIMGVKGEINLVAFKERGVINFQDNERVKELVRRMKYEIDPLFVIRPFWREYESLLEAVKVEKFSISLILQIIVIVAIFNVVAFVIFLNEKKSKEIFLFQALGLSKLQLIKGWSVLIFLVWAASCFVAYLFTKVFAWMLLNVSVFQLPGDIYTLSQINLKVSSNTFIIVSSLALIWLILCTSVIFWNMRKKSIMSQLKVEYS